MENSYKYFKNTDCKYFPCHEGLSDDFNCLFCYCPMYSMPNCPGSKTYIKKNGKKNQGMHRLYVSTQTGKL